jgi:hypothetical protein
MRSNKSWVAQNQTKIQMTAPPLSIAALFPKA